MLKKSLHSSYLSDFQQWEHFLIWVCDLHDCSIRCELISFDIIRNKCPINREPIKDEFLGGDEKAVWVRKDSPYAGAPTLVQFCNLRGRLNCPTACLCKRDAMCRNYEDFEHAINVEDVDA